MPIVSIESVDRRCAGERGPGETCGAAVEQHPRLAIAPGELTGGVRVDDRRPRRARSSGRDADQVEHAALSLRDHVARQVRELQTRRECGNVTEGLRGRGPALGVFRHQRPAAIDGTAHPPVGS